MSVNRQGNRVASNTMMRGLKRWLLVLFMVTIWLPTANATTNSVASSVAAGEYHTCALTSDGAVQCWGDNGKGQLGNDNLRGSTTPVTVSDLPVGIVSIASGSQHNCALNSTGGVSCWGDNTFGQLGNGTQITSGVPVDVSAISGDVVAIAAGGAQTCALSVAGDVWCWGDNRSGQIGDGTTIQTSIPVRVIGLSNPVVSISVGAQHACALTADGSVLCWGDNANGQLGNGTQNASNIPVAVNGLNNVISAIAAGGQHTCALATDGGVKCWGDNSLGQLGNGNGAKGVVSTKPVDVTGLATGVVGIAASSQTCAVKFDGSVLCWGDNLSGQLSVGGTTLSTVPVPVPGLTEGISAIAAGYSHTCVMTTAGSLQCVGDNSFGQLGDGTISATTHPAAVTGYEVMTQSSNVITVTAPAGLPATVMTADAGTAMSLAATVQSGQLAIYTSLTPNQCKLVGSSLSLIAEGICLIEISSPASGNFNAAPSILIEVVVLPAGTGGATTVKVQSNSPTLAAPRVAAAAPLSQAGQSISFGPFQSLTLLSQPFNINASASSGLPVSFSSATPQICSVSGSTVTGVTPGLCVVAADQPGDSSHLPAQQVTHTFLIQSQIVAAGMNHSCAVDGGGAVTCWGDNSFGQLGNGTTVASGTPVAVPAYAGGIASGAVAIAAGNNFTCALSSSGGVRCWGDNANGQLGNSSYVSATSPVDVFGLSAGVIAISAGANHACAVTRAGAALCWGLNTNGQLGSAIRYTTAYTPQPVVGLGTGVKAIAAGFEHTCAIYSAGAAWCWGRNVEGELGDGTTAIAFTPSPVTGLSSGVTSIVTGYMHTCALTGAGAVYCWGTNSWGQLGTPVNSGGSSPNPVPLQVTGLTSGVASITAGQFHNCAVTTAGAMQCWGADFYGELGWNVGNYWVGQPVNVAGLSSGVVSTAAGQYHTCAVTDDGVVRCWGYDYFGQVGDGGQLNVNSPKPVSGLNLILRNTISFSTIPDRSLGAVPFDVSVSANSGLPIVITSTTPAVCSVSGITVTIVGTGTCTLVADQAGTNTVPAAPSVTQRFNVISQTIAAGGYHTCAMNGAGPVLCWGSNSYGQLGNGTNIDTYSPFAANGLPSGLVSIVAGTYHTCVLTNVGNVLCWGDNTYGQLGNGTTTGSATPIQVLGLPGPVVSIATGDFHTCAVTAGGAVWCWGTNYYGELGNGTSVDSSLPVAVTGLSIGIASLAAGNSHTCAVTNLGQVRCWGEAFTGYVWNGQAWVMPSPSWTPISGLSLSGNAISIAAGGARTCALTDVGSVYCWDITTPFVPPSAPVLIAGVPSDARLLSVELTTGAYSCALTSSGVASCWGTNFNAIVVPTPTVDPALSSGVLSISVGYEHACAVLNNGSMMCWGWNPYGGLGTVSSYDANAPALVASPIYVLNQTISFGALPNTLLGSAPFQVSATSNSLLAVSISSATPAVCSVSGTNTVTVFAVGTCTLVASQGGNGYIVPASVTRSFAVQQSQTITFGTAPVLSVGKTANVSATASSGLTVAYSSLSSGTCSVSGNILTGIAVGTCTIAANQPGNSTYMAAPQVTQSIRVGLGAQSIVFGTAPVVTVKGSGTLAATGGASVQPVTFSSTTPTICTVSGSTVTGILVGTCVVAANQLGNTNYNAAAQVTQNIAVGKGSQTITFGAAPSILPAQNGTLSATASSGLIVAFSSLTTSVCTVSGNLVHGVTGGTCQIAANQAGNANFNAAAQATQTFRVLVGTQNISFVLSGAVSVGGSALLTPTGGASGNPVILTSTTPAVCTVSGNLVTGVSVAGGTFTCGISATQAGNASYAAGSTTTAINILKGSQTITSIAVDPTLTVGGSATLSAMGGASGNPIVFSTSTPAICSVSGNTLSGVTAGACILAADQAGNADYNAAAQATQVINVGQAGSQSIVFGAPPAASVGRPVTLSAAAGSSGNPVTFGSLTPATCTVGGNTLTPVMSGTCTVAADQAGNGSYTLATQVSQTFRVNASVVNGKTHSCALTSDGGVQCWGDNSYGQLGNGTVSAARGVAKIPAAVPGLSSGVMAITAGGNHTCALTSDGAVMCWGNTTTGLTEPTPTAVTGLSGKVVAIAAGAFHTCAVTGAGGVQCWGDNANGQLGDGTAGSNPNNAVSVRGLTSGVIALAAGQYHSCAVTNAGTVQCWGDNSSGQLGNGSTTVWPASISTPVAVTGLIGNAVSITAGYWFTCAVNETGAAQCWGNNFYGALGNGTTNASTAPVLVSGLASGVVAIAAGDYHACALTSGGAVQCWGYNVLGGLGNGTNTLSSAPVAVTGLATGAISIAAGGNSSCAETSAGVPMCWGDNFYGQLGNNTYGGISYTPVSVSGLNLFVRPQSISFLALPNLPLGSTPLTLNATASSGLSVTFNSSTPTVCTVSGSTVNLLAVGTCTIAANQTGNASFYAAPQVTQSFTISQGSQTIVLGAAPSVVVGSSGLLIATGGASGNTLNFISTTGTCSVGGSNGNTVTGLAVGLCIVQVTQDGNANYLAAPLVTIQLSIGQASQTIVFGAPPTVTYGGTGTISATGGASGNAVTFASQTAGVCAVSGNTVTGVTAGNCTIAASQAGNVNYAAAQATQSFTVSPASQTINFGAAPNLTYGATGTLATTGGGSGNLVVFSSQTTGVCTVNGNNVTGVTAGTCTIAANQAGSTNYLAAAQTTQTFSIGQASQVITLGTAPNVVVGGTGTLSATGGASGNPVTFITPTMTICTVSGNTVTGVSAGTCIVTAIQAGNTNYLAAPAVNQTLTIGQGGQTIIFGAAPTVVYGGKGPLSATGGASGNPVTFSSQTVGVCTVNASVVTALTAGTCTIAANQAGNANFAAASQVTQTFNIGQASQTVNLNTLSSYSFVDGPTTWIASASSGLPVTLGTSTPTICSISGTNVTGLAVGTCTITADQAGNVNYLAAAQVQKSIPIYQGPQTITFGTAPMVSVGGTGTVSATGGASGNPVTFSAMTPATCTVSGNTVTGVTAGTCAIAANQAGNANYLAATAANQTISIGQGSQILTFGTAPTVVMGGTGIVTASGGASGNPVTFSSTTPTICTVSGSAVTGVAAGTCTITANQAGNTNYSAATQTTQTFSIGQASQTVSFTGLTFNIPVGGTTTMNATASSGLPVTLGTSTSTICSISGNVVTGLAAGTCTVTADQAGNANYLPAVQASRSIPIRTVNQTLTFGTAPTVVVGGTGALSATGGASGNPVIFSSLTAGICTVSGNTVTGVTVGICTIAADQAGNANYNAATQVTQTFSVGQASQSITLGAAPNQLVVGGTGTLSAAASSGLPVTFNSLTTGVCTVSGNTVSAFAFGTCTIAANQAGNANYSAAVQVQQSVTVGRASQAITFTSPPPINATVGATYTPTATATSGQTVVLSVSSSTTAFCTISNGVVTFTGAGSCTINANQAGNVNYNAATQAAQAFTIAKGNQTITFGMAPTVIVGGTGTLSASAGASGNPVTFTSMTPATCTVSGSTVTGVTAGTCSILATQPGNSNYLAAPQATQTLTIDQASQTINFPSLPPILAVNQPINVGASASSGLAVTLTSSTPAVCAVNGLQVIGLAPGTCTLIASQPGDSNYAAAAPVSQSLTVNQALQTITLQAPLLPPSVTYAPLGSAPIPLNATASSGLPVQFTSLTSATCAIQGLNMLVLNASGPCNLLATQSGNGTYAAAAAVPLTTMIQPASQIIAFGAAPSIVVGSTGTVSATASSGLAVTFSSLTPGVCTVSGNQVKGIAAGTCTIAADQGGNANYSAAAQVQQQIAVSPATQTITFGPAPTILAGSSGTITATGGASGYPITFSSLTGSVCSVSGNIVTGLTGGTCSIAANQQGDANYYAATQVQLTFTVNAANQTIAFGAVPTVVVGSTGTVSATASSGLAVTFSSLTPGVCTVNGNAVKGIAGGTCTIAANQSGNATYSAATQVTQSLAVGPASQAITFGNAPVIAVGGTGTLSATGGASGYPVTFNSLTGSICSVTLTAGSVTGLAAGTCTIAANQQGNANYYAPPQTTLSFPITQGTQTVTFGTAPTVVVGGTGPLSVTSSAVLPVSFTSTTPATCAVSGSTVTGLAVGSCVVAANQAGNVNYTAATQVTQTINIGASVAAPSAPTNIAVQLTTAQPQAVVSWTDTSSNEASWLVQRSVNGGSTWTTVQTLTRSTGAASGETVSSSPITVNWGAKYLFRVVARNAAGQGISATATLDMTASPAAPTLVLATAALGGTTDAVTVSWTSQSNNEVDFAIQRCRLTTTNPCTGNTGWNSVGTTAINVTSWSQTGVLRKSTYAYRVQASNPNGNSAWVRSPNLVTP
jgi:alpha-tubulin suppressor-like RCC1 family protein